MGTDSSGRTQHQRFEAGGRSTSQKMLEERAYEVAMEKFLSVDPVKLKKPGTGYPRRDKLHGR